MTDQTGRPLYIEVAAKLRRAISAGTFPVGGELPSTTKLTKQYGVSTTVVRAAIRELRTEGLVTGQQGKAVYVTATPEQTDEPRDVDARLRTLAEQVQTALHDLDARVKALEAVTRPEERP